MNSIVLYLSAFLLILGNSLKAQAPQGINYQAIVRNNNNLPVANTAVTLQVNILQNTPTGTPVYSETHSPMTDAFGVVSIRIGQGAPISGAFSTINWGAGPCYINTKVDLGSGYIDMSTTQMMSVPYALYAENSGNPGNTGPTGPTGTTGGTGPTGTFQNGNIRGQMLYWNGIVWQTIEPGDNNQTLSFCYGEARWGACPPLAVGIQAYGGIVAYILQPGDPGYNPTDPHGLIVTPTDLNDSIGIGIAWSLVDTIVGTSINFGTGATNTAAAAAIIGSGNYAPVLCQNLVLNGYSDWYLPSAAEMIKIGFNKSVIGGFRGDYYWTSSEYDRYPGTRAHLIYLGSDNLWQSLKSIMAFVRPVRSFPFHEQSLFHPLLVYQGLKNLDHQKLPPASIGIPSSLVFLKICALSSKTATLLNIEDSETSSVVSSKCIVYFIALSPFPTW